MANRAATKTENGTCKAYYETREGQWFNVEVTKKGTTCKVRIGHSGNLPKNGAAADRLIRSCIQNAERNTRYNRCGAKYKGFNDNPSKHYNTKESLWTFDVRVRNNASPRYRSGYCKLTGTPVSDLHVANRVARTKARSTKAGRKASDRRGALRRAKQALSNVDLRLLGLIK